MRKRLAFISVMALVLVGFLALANPVASCDDGFEFEKCALLLCTGDGDSIYEVGEVITWLFTIEVKNNNDWTMTDVIVKDRLAAEYGVDEIIGYDGDFLDVYTKGASEKVFIDWYIGDLGPGDTALLEMIISTDLNPSGKQEYTSPGCYEINSGAVLKFINNEGSKVSAETGPLSITVVEP